MRGMEKEFAAMNCGESMAIAMTMEKYTASGG
jgi:hypothetical protein